MNLSNTTSQVLIDGARNFVIRLTGVQDGTGTQLTNVKVIDVATMMPPSGPSFKIRRMQFKVMGGIVQLAWETSVLPAAPKTFAELQLTGDDHYFRFGGQSTRGVPNATGSVLLSTLGFDVGSSYDLTIEAIKGVGTQFG